MLTSRILRDAATGKVCAMSRTVFYKYRDAHWREDCEALKELANQATEDPSIVNYFTRKYVKAADVIAIVATNKNFAECMKAKTFEAYAENRKEVDELDRQVTALADAGLSTWKAIFVTLTTAWTALLIVSEIGQKPGIGAFAIPCTVFAASVAVGAGSLLKRKKLAHALSATTLCGITLLISTSVCSVALPVAFSLFPWQPAGAYVDAVIAFFAGAMLGKETVLGIRDLAEALVQTCICIIGWRRRKRARGQWLDHSFKTIIYPKSVLSINHILGEDSTKLLVEQDSDGLRRLQDPKLIISTRSEHRLQHLLNRMDGGSIAVTGPRGAGKR
jgi:hypothetical protein